MKIDEIAGVGDFEKVEERVDEHNTREIYKVNEHAFLVVNKHTVEMRSDQQLKNLLVEKYESVMESRYFGRGGIEVVTEGRQLEEGEMEDLIRLSYNLTKEMQ